MSRESIGKWQSSPHLKAMAYEHFIESKIGCAVILEIKYRTCSRLTPSLFRNAPFDCPQSLLKYLSVNFSHSIVLSQSFSFFRSIDNTEHLCALTVFDYVLIVKLDVRMWTSIQLSNPQLKANRFIDNLRKSDAVCVPPYRFS